MTTLIYIELAKYETTIYRIWGDQGQFALEQANICLLNCGPTGAEALKNLVLGGIGSFTIVDASKVEAKDLGNNFFGIFSLLLCFSFPIGRFYSPFLAYHYAQFGLRSHFLRTEM